MDARTSFVACMLALAAVAVPAAPVAAQSDGGETLLGLDFDLYRDEVEPIFLNRRPGNARCVGLSTYEVRHGWTRRSSSISTPRGTCRMTPHLSSGRTTTGTTWKSGRKWKNSSVDGHGSPPGFRYGR